MEGKWEIRRGSALYHLTFLKAKRHCTLEDNCFAVITDDNNFLSINFPIWLTQGESWYTHKKKRFSGGFIDLECLLINT